MTRSSDEATRLRTLRQLFEAAIARGTTVSEVRNVLASERWSAIETRLAAKRCGTVDRSLVDDTEAENGERQLAWWHR